MAVHACVARVPSPVQHHDHVLDSTSARPALVEVVVADADVLWELQWATLVQLELLKLVELRGLCHRERGELRALAPRSLSSRRGRRISATRTEQTQHETQLRAGLLRL